MQRQHRIRRGARSQAAVSLASPSALRGLLPLGEWEQNTGQIGKPSAAAGQGWALENGLWTAKPVGPLRGRMSLRHGTSTFPTAYLWHFSGRTAVCFTSGPSLCQQKEGGIRRFPVMPYSASQRSSPIHACGMRWDRTNARHSPRAETQVEREMKKDAGSCKICRWLMELPRVGFQGDHCLSEDPLVSFELGPEKAWREWGIYSKSC